MLIRFTTPCVLGTAEYASGDEADMPNDVANAALSLGRAVRVMSAAVLTAAPDAVLTAAPDAAVEPAAPTADPVGDSAATSLRESPAPDDGDGRPKRRLTPADRN